MIRSIRRKFTFIAMLSLIGTMAVLCAAIGIGNHCITANRVDRAISVLRQNGRSFLPSGSHPAPQTSISRSPRKRPLKRGISL